MLKKRIIPKLLLQKSKDFPEEMVLVTSKRFNDHVAVGDPVSQAKIYESQLADELVVLNIERRQPIDDSLLQLLQDFAEEVFLPLTYGGGVRTLDEFTMLLSSGADKVSINSAAIDEPEFIARAARLFGSQCVVVSIDYSYIEGKHFVYKDHGRERTNIGLLDWIFKVVELGAGEVILNSIDRDGSRKGLDIDIAKKVAESISVPVVMSGGAGKSSDFVEALSVPGVGAVAASTFFCFKDENPIQTRSRVFNAGIPIRVET